MAKYQFKKKSNEPSDEQIRSKMDFAKVLQQHQDIQHYKSATKPLYKKPFFLGFVILLGVICLVLVFDGDEAPEEAASGGAADTVKVDSLKK